MKYLSIVNMNKTQSFMSLHTTQSSSSHHHPLPLPKMMQSLSVKPPKLLSITTPFFSPHPFPSSQTSTKPLYNPKLISISCLLFPQSPSSQRPKAQPPPQSQTLYQPFRPPPSPLPSKFQNLDTNARLEILSNRLASWFEYAPLIPSLLQEGFSSDSLEEITGITGIEQNRLVVAAKVRETLVESNVESEFLGFFDNGGAELLYEIRSLSNKERAAAVRYFVGREFDGKKTGELAKAMKDYRKRRGDEGWGAFDGNLPGDCLAFMYFRQSRENLMATSEDTRRVALERALEVVETEGGRIRIVEEMEGKGVVEKVGEGAVEDGGRVPVVRMKIGEVSEAKVVVVLPVCRVEDGGVDVEEAPWECSGRGEFGIVEAEKEWGRWIVLPGWEPITGLIKGGVVVEYKNADILPWKANRWSKEEAILVVADRGQKEVVENDGLYLVVGGRIGSGEEGLKVMERGSTLKKIGVTQSLGRVVLVVRPPKYEDDELLDED